MKILDELELKNMSTDFVEELLTKYLVDRDFTPLSRAAHPEISWFGPGNRESSYYMKDYDALLSVYEKSWDSENKMYGEFNDTVVLNDTDCLVYGHYKFESGRSSNLEKVIVFRFSIITRYENGKFYLFHVHFSKPHNKEEVKEYNDTEHVKMYNEVIEDKLDELQTLTNSISGGVIYCEDDEFYTINYVSKSFAKLIGYDEEELSLLVGMKYTDFIVEEDLEKAREVFNKQAKNGERLNTEYRIRRKDGEVIWVIENGVMAKSKTGTNQLNCLVIDNSKQRKQQEKLEISDKRYRLAMEFSDLFLYEYDIKENTIEFFGDLDNFESLPDFIEGGVETLIQRGIIHEASIKTARELFDKLRSGVDEAEAEISIVDETGEVLHNLFKMMCIFSQDGEPIKAIGVQKNIGEIISLQRENEFARSFISGRVFVCEANVSKNKILSVNEDLQPYFKVSKEDTLEDFVKKMANSFVSEESKSHFERPLSEEVISQLYESGKHYVSFECYINEFGNNDKFRWIKISINIIKDERTNEYILRIYLRDINEAKEIQIAAEKHRNIYKEMLENKAVVSYEANVTKDLILGGTEHWLSSFGIKASSKYSEMVDIFTKRFVYYEDVDKFCSLYSRDAILANFKNGVSSLSGEYRRNAGKGEYRWCAVRASLYVDPDTGDVCGFAYIEDIHEVKLKELELLYNAEHDNMTGLYNKGITEEKINDYMRVVKEKSHVGAVMLIDLDNFKAINDNFGHSYGDDVLKEVANDIKVAFRSDDVIGRIGGDEFLVLVKNIDNEKIIFDKADLMCKKLEKSYQKDGVCVKISSSIGIAFTSNPKFNGENISELADEAMYRAKKSGKNKYSL